MRLRTAPKIRRPIRPEQHGYGELPPRPAAQPEPTRRRRGPSRRQLIVGALLLVLLAGLAVATWLTMPRLERVDAPTLTNDPTPTFELRVVHPLAISESKLRVTIDGDALGANAVELTDGGARIMIDAPRLEDGEHDVRVTVADAGLLRTTLDTHWTLTVDTTAPEAKVVEPVPAKPGTSPYLGRGVAPVTALPLRMVVDAEPGATVSVDSDRRDLDPITSRAGAAGRHEIEVPLPEGAQQLTVVTTDAAGNETEHTLRVLVDTTGPALTVRTPRVVKDAKLALPIAARDAHGVTIEAKLDGRVLEDVIDVAASTPAPNAATSAAADGAATDEEVAGDGEDAGEEPVAPIALRGALTLEAGAFEGRHLLEVTATDALGTKTVVKRAFIVDSTEDIGAASGLRIGARGADVGQLHAALIERKVVGRQALAQDLGAKTFGEQTRAAVQAFQKQQGMDVDGVAGSDTIAALTLKIVIDRSANTLTLYRNGAVAKVYPVATGSAEYPTPAGEFRIHDMQRNPTWTPPDSEWAKDAKPIPPGPDNPLGTRWMRIDGAVGIHGTNNPASLGYSVSHGCIRMSIPDVEELFEIVRDGTPVTVV